MSSPDLDRLGNVVPPGYEYYEKHVTPGEDVSLPAAYFKWYDIYPTGQEITAKERSGARALVAAEMESLRIRDELGFVILHRAGTVLLLMILTWRQTNEVWEAAYVADPANGGGYIPFSFETHHKATFCVWELAAVWHERQAWVRFLSSKRDTAAKLAYVDDRFSGKA